VLPLADRAVWTLDNYAQILDARLVSTAWDTFVFVGGSLLVAFGFGVPIAWALERTDLPGRRVLSALLFLPLLIPPITNAQLWSALLAPETGLLNKMLRVVVPVSEGPIENTSAIGMVIAQGLTYMPLVALFVGVALRGLDAPLEEAAKLSGAGPLVTFRRVTAPLLVPSMLNTALLIGVFLLGQFEIPLIFGINTGLKPVGIVIYDALRPAASVPFYGQIAAYSVLTTFVSYALILAYARVTTRAGKYATVTGKGHRTNVVPLHRMRWPLFALVALFFFATVGLRVFLLVWQSFMPFLGEVNLDVLVEQATLDGYQRVLGDPVFWSSVRLTVVVAVVSSVVTTTLGIVMAWTVSRHRGGRTARAALDLMASSSIGIPAPVAAFAFLIIFLALGRWLPLYGTLTALVIAYCFRLGLAYRVASSAMVQLGQQLEEAASMSGATPLVTFRRIVLPLLGPTVAVLLLLGVITAVQEFTVPLFLATTGDQPLSVYSYNLLATQQSSAAAAVGVLTLLVIMVLALVAGWVARRRSWS
jgi:iron(III) transport system permease protein